jgi:ribosomal-protein-alanine N-acetyltransferase
MRDDVRIVLAAPADIDAIHRIEAASFPAPWRREFFESELHGSGRFCLAAKRGAKVIGYLFSMWFFDEMHINKIAVEEDERRAGIANELMKQCLKFANEHGIKTISLEVRKSNTGAQEFYRTLHFVPQYTRPRYYPDGETAVVMMRVISD